MICAALAARGRIAAGIETRMLPGWTGSLIVAFRANGATIFFKGVVGPAPPRSRCCTELPWAEHQPLPALITVPALPLDPARLGFRECCSPRPDGGIGPLGHARRLPSLGPNTQILAGPLTIQIAMWIVFSMIFGDSSCDISRSPKKTGNSGGDRSPKIQRPDSPMMLGMATTRRSLLLRPWHQSTRPMILSLQPSQAAITPRRTTSCGHSLKPCRAFDANPLRSLA